MTDRVTRALLTLTFVTGIVDAVCFLALGQAFAAMQTGNVIFLGLGLADAGGVPFLAPALSLVAFLLGSVVAAIVTTRSSGSGSVGLRAAVAVEFVLIATAAILVATVDPDAHTFAAYAGLSILALAMGIRNTVVRGIGDQNLATTVLNLTLTTVTAATPPGLAPESDLARRGLAFGVIVSGAVCGALLTKSSAGLALGIAALATLTVLWQSGVVSSSTHRPGGHP